MFDPSDWEQIVSTHTNNVLKIPVDDVDLSVTSPSGDRRKMFANYQSYYVETCLDGSGLSAGARGYLGLYNTSGNAIAGYNDLYFNGIAKLTSINKMIVYAWKRIK